MATKENATSSTLVIDQTTVVSLLTVLGILITAYTLSTFHLRRDTSTTVRILYVWHAFDSIIHFVFEGSFLYNCFFTYISTPANIPLQRPHYGQFLGFSNRLYGSAYGTSPTAKLWQEYAKADARWGQADPTIISLELLTVCIGGPLAAYVCYLLGKNDPRVWFWGTVLATGELYGGFITFAPEWLTTSSSLDTSNFMYLWVYLTFFNVLWVLFPLWFMYEAFQRMTAAFNVAAVGKKNVLVKKNT